VFTNHVETPSVKFYGNPFSNFQVVTCGQTVVVKLFHHFLQLVINMPDRAISSAEMIVDYCCMGM